MFSARPLLRAIYDLGGVLCGAVAVGVIVRSGFDEGWAYTPFVVIAGIAGAVALSRWKGKRRASR